MVEAIAFTAVVACTALSCWLVRVRRRLRCCQRAFDVLATKAPIAILQADDAGMCVFANDAWYAISGLTAAETLGHAWSRVVHPDDLPSVMAKWEASVRSGEPYVNEVRLVRPDGGERTVMAGGAAIRDAAGRITGFIGTVLDITARRAAEREARRIDALLGSFVDNVPAAIYVKDAAGRYLLANRHHTELWPTMRGFRPGATPFEFFPGDVARAFLETDRRVLEARAPQTFEELIPHDDGPRPYLTVKFPVVDEHGRPFAVGGVSTDVTELVAARRTLAAREQLLRTLIDVQEAEKQTLCHEFHDGLIQYTVGSKMLLEGVRHGPIPEASRQVIESAIDYLAKGLEDGRRVIRGIRPAVLDDLGLHAALGDMCADAREAGIDVEACISPAVDGILPPLQMTAYRIVQEALANARKHSGTDRLRVEARTEGDWLVLVVEDFGRGFDPDAVADPTGAGLDAPRGLGLLGIRERARLAGGSCEISSAPGRGTRVCAHVSLRVPDSSDADCRGKAGCGDDCRRGAGDVAHAANSDTAPRTVAPLPATVGSRG